MLLSEVGIDVKLIHSLSDESPVPTSLYSTSYVSTFTSLLGEKLKIASDTMLYLFLY